MGEEPARVSPKGLRSGGLLMWSRAAQSVWGKTDRASDSWLPLVSHVHHVAAMADLLWDHFFPASLKRRLSELLALPEDATKAIYVFLAGTHDTGKASVVFAQQAIAFLPSVVAGMRNAGLAIEALPADQYARHEEVSQLAIRDWLIDTQGASPIEAMTWAAILGGHHGRHPGDSKVSATGNRPRALGDQRWSHVRTEIVDRMATIAGIPDLPTDWARREVPVPAQMLLTSMVVLADWLGSDQQRFPFHDDLAPQDRAAIAYADYGLPRPWSPTPPPRDVDAHLHLRFPTLASVPARPIQRAMVDAAWASNDPPLLIAEAPMGVGKTEAALLAAEVLAQRYGLGGVFIGLPTMATANPMFDRTLNWLETALGDDDASVALAHGKAGLNDRYAGLLADSWHGQIYDEDVESPGHAVADSWLRGRRRAGLASFVVGTIDQCLFGALKARHVSVRHLGLAGKVVVVDEVHAADTYMREYLKRILTWLAAYGTPVILMSATLPPQQRDEYVAAYARGRSRAKPALTDRRDTYPRVTMYDGQLTDQQVAATTETTLVDVHRITDDMADTVKLLDGLLHEGGCAAVICNTVGRAQDAYTALTEEFGECVVLLHSRFLAPERATRERNLVAQLGPRGERPRLLIVVGTQVLEQSLDVDFDVMITDVAPIDLVLQRCGRLHRHTRPDRPAAVRAPALYLRGMDDWAAAPPQPVRGSRTVYGAAPLLRTAALLAPRSHLALPADIPVLVREGYDPDLAPPAGWEEAWRHTAAADAAASAASAARAQTYLLTPPSKPETLAGILDVEAADPERAEERGGSAVRDSEDSLEIIALFRDEDGSLRLPACAPRHPGAVIPTGCEWGATGQEASVARAMATCTIGLPRELTNDAILDRVLDELERAVDYSGWQKSPWISKQLVLVFDTHNRASLAGRNLHYSHEHGLRVTTPKEPT